MTDPRPNMPYEPPPIVKILLTVAALLLLAGNGWAAVPEIPGNGYDDASSGHTFGACPSGWMNAVYGATGCDRKAPSPDEDRDGYYSDGTGPNAGTDCDDNDRRVYPGAPDPNSATNCGANQYRTCQSSGTWSSCANLSTYNPATGSGVTYWFDDTGSNSTGNGTYANPWRDYLCVTDSSLGCYHAPVAGDAYVFRSGTYSGTQTGPYKFRTTADGTASNPIIIESAPGETATIDGSVATASNPMIFETANYWKVKRLTLQGAAATDTNTGAFVSSSTNIEFDGVTVHSIGGDGDLNVSGIKIVGTSSDAIDFHHGLIRDSFKISGNVENIRLFTNMDGKNVTIRDSVLFYTTKDAATQGAPIGWKHGSTTGYGKALRNIIWNSPTYAIDAGQPNFEAKHNLIANSAVCFALREIGGYASFDANLIEYNTCYDADLALIFTPTTTYDASLGQVTWRKNVYRGNVASYGADSGVVRVWYYGTQPQHDAFVSAQNLLSSNNSYYNAGAAALYYTFFGNGVPTYGTRTTTFSTFQARYAGFEDSSNSGTDPAFDSYLDITASGQTDRGWLGDFGPGTTTTTTTTTTTLVTGLPSVFPQ